MCWSSANEYASAESIKVKSMIGKRESAPNTHRFPASTMRTGGDLMSTEIRQQRVAELIFEEMSIMLAGELQDPRISLVRVTDVRVSKDLRNVRVFVCHDDETVSRRELLKALQNATSYLRRQLAERLSLRAVPELLFSYDDSLEKAARVQELLRQIAAERAARNAGENA
uniref:Ribosome-binding factor A n=1 Tax=Caldilinea aerophila TaxID=133453 RepID=A0A7C1FE99_9CHLR